jgi:hypothetical protein
VASGPIPRRRQRSDGRRGGQRETGAVRPSGGAADHIVRLISLTAGHLTPTASTRVAVGGLRGRGSAERRRNRAEKDSQTAGRDQQTSRRGRLRSGVQREVRGVSGVAPPPAAAASLSGGGRLLCPSAASVRLLAALHRIASRPPASTFREQGVRWAKAIASRPVELFGSAVQPSRSLRLRLAAPSARLSVSLCVLIDRTVAQLPTRVQS